MCTTYGREGRGWEREALKLGREPLNLELLASDSNAVSKAPVFHVADLKADHGITVAVQLKEIHGIFSRLIVYLL